MTDHTTVKQRLESIPRGLPLIRDAGDPVVAGFLWLLMIAAVVGVVEAGHIFPNDHEARSHVIQMVGGAILVLGAYFTANRLDIQRSQQRAEMLSRLLDQVGSPNPVVRAGAIPLVQNVVLELPRTRAGEPQKHTSEQAIRDALETLRATGTCDAITTRAINDVIDLLRTP